MDIFGRLLPLDPSSHHHACAPLRKQCLSNFASFSLSFLTTLIGLQLPPNLKFLLLYLLSLSTPLFPRLLSLYIFNFTPRLSKQPVSPQLLYLPFLPRLLLLFSHFLLCLQSPCHLYLLHRRSIHPKCPETPAILSSIILDSKNPPPQAFNTCSNTQCQTLSTTPTPTTHPQNATLALEWAISPSSLPGR